MAESESIRNDVNGMTSSECDVTPSHQIAGVSPEKCYLNVIPEARKLYGATSGFKRKIDKANEQYGCRIQKQSSSSGSNSDQENDPLDTESLRNKFMRSRSGKRRRQMSFRSIIYEIDDALKDFRLSDGTYTDIMNLLERDIARGLSGNQQTANNHPNTVPMYPTYVRSLPDGTESGRFLALDLGGTNFRVLLVNLRGAQEPELKSKVYLIPEMIMLGPGKQLFAHIADCMHDFLQREQLLNIPEYLNLGFTFSFPCIQMGLASAKLARWTKGFKCSGVVNQDVVALLDEAVKARGEMKIMCKAIINDPVGALMAGAYEHEHCHVGLILGTGTNCCYMEKLDNVKRWDQDVNHPKQVVVNTEWGSFGECGCLNFMRNRFDYELDRLSLNNGQQVFEKMISGMYMGELVRLVLIELASNLLLFGGEISDSLLTPYRFFTKYISEIESDDPDGTFSNTRMVLQELDIPNFTLNDCRYVQHVCWQVSQRSAYLAATAVATVIRRLDKPMVTIAVDGSLYRFHPHFSDLMKKKITKLIKPEQKFDLVLSHDGSGKGAALVAAVATKQQNRTGTSAADTNGNSMNLNNITATKINCNDENTHNIQNSQSDQDGGNMVLA